MFTDETNKEASGEAKFFIYGGVFVPANKLNDLHVLVDKVRNDNGFKSEDEFKFAPNTRPDHISRDRFTKAKGELLIGCSKLGLKFSACLTLHYIARNKSLEQLVSFGANTIISVFDQFLHEENSHGVCILDRLPFVSGYQYLQEKFRKGLIFPNGNIKKLNKILMYASSCEGASHALSAIDIILGAFRYCVNKRDKDIAPKKMFPIIASMMWHKKIGDTIYLRERGLLFRPKTIAVPEYEIAYTDLTEHFKKLIDENGKS
jgi:hypothetical protein